MNSLGVLDKCLGLREGTKRLTELLKQPGDDQTSDWFMCVPSCYCTGSA